MQAMKDAFAAADAHLATLKREDQVLDDIRAILVEAGNCIASGRVKEGKDLVDQLVAILSKDAS